ncbi:myb-like protein X [Pistacia vera]|uniref:myb-like protein X n=1 Tax=Pistacia vera TaxID=55513 RepID=UPI001263E345|nr:myb-like protein X [Pistacia vera]
MEDPYLASEGSIQEYSSEESSGKVRWILNKGLAVGKKILVAGFVISSAPVVVPPLVVISFLGFACSVPYGLLLASYACTDKLMSMLLPGSKPPPFLLDYVKVSNNDEVVQVDEYGEGEDLWLKGGIDMEKEEEEMLEDTRETIEMRIELVENENENENDHYVDEVEHGGVVREDENEIEGENGYEEDVGEYEDENEQEPTKLEFEVRMEGVGEEEEKEPVLDDVLAVVVDTEGDEKSSGTTEDVAAPFETDIVVELCQNNESNEDEEMVKETRGLLEKIREEGMTDSEEKNKQSVEKLSGEAEEGHQQVNRNVQEMGMPMEGRIGNKPLGNVENDNDEIPKESYKVQETEDERNADVISKEGDSKEMVGGLLKPIGEKIETTDVGSIEKEEQNPVLNKPSMLQREADNNITKDVEKDIQLSREKENVISSNADVREIADESGFDLFDNKNGAAHSYSDYNTVGENEHSSSICASHGAGIRPQEGSCLASSKELYSEEKIWEQIDAMRRIVGYKAAPQGTCIEELKAMYLFTGIQPPALFKDPSDLVEVNEKLRFLMSIVGVK